nr:hypothetical protein GCM10020093_108850 [Planobispora longispora]
METLLGRWFVARVSESDPVLLHWVLSMVHGVDAESYAACCEAISGYDLTARLPEISAPALVIAGAEDPATPVEHSLTLARGIPGSLLIVVPGAAHLANVEQAEAVTAAIVRHLGGKGSGGSREGGGEDAREAGDREAGDQGSREGGDQGGRGNGREDDRRAAGMRTRREVLGDAHVDRAVANTTPSPRTSRTSSPATPGTRSGTVPAWTGAPAAASR